MTRSKVNIAALLAAGTMATANAVDFTNENMKVDVGADMRFRYDITKDLPDDKHTESRHSDYLRMRVRPWFKISGTQEYHPFFAIRLADEFRYYRRPMSDRRKQRFPDVGFID